MLVKTYASAVQGVEAQTITVEVNTGGEARDGKDFFNLVGLPDSAVREGFARIEAAIKNIGMRMLRVKLVVNLAPADIRKEGAAYDLPIALAYLAGSRQISADELDQYVIMGELSLDGSLRPITGALSIAIQARRENFKGIILVSSGFFCLNDPDAAFLGFANFSFKVLKSLFCIKTSPLISISTGKSLSKIFSGISFVLSLFRSLLFKSTYISHFLCGLIPFYTNKLQ